MKNIAIVVMLLATSAFAAVTADVTPKAATTDVNGKVALTFSLAISGGEKVTGYELF